MAKNSGKKFWQKNLASRRSGLAVQNQRRKTSEKNTSMRLRGCRLFGRKSQGNRLLNQNP